LREILNERKKLVFPGSFLSIGEEFLPGQNAFEHLDGNIYSSSVGEPVYDKDQKEVNVNGRTKPAKLVDAGSIVFARIKFVRESKASVEILQAENNDEKRKIGGLHAILPVFNVDNSYVKNLTDFFKIGDIIKARVANVTPFNVELETKSNPALGIVKGFCTNCRAALKMVQNGVKCPKCAMSAQRKFSTEYLVK